MRRGTAILACGGVALIAACGGDDTSAEGGTLTFANWQWQEPGRGEAIYAAVEAYNDENPDVQIEKIEITRADYESTISTQIGAGEGPDIFVSPLPFFYTLADSAALEPLDDVPTPEIEDTLRPNNEELNIDGEQLAFVWGIAPYALFWNENIVEEAGVEPPQDIDDLIQAAQAIHEETGNIGFATRHQMNEEAAWWDDFSSWAYGFGPGWSQDGELTINSEENVAAVTAFKEIYDSGAFAVGDDASTFRSKFSAGDVGFVLDNATVVTTSLANSDDLTTEDIGSSPLPFPTGSSAAQTNVVAVNANSDQADLAKDFIQWLLKEENQQNLAEAQFPAATGTTVLPPDELIEENQWVEAFYAQLEDSQGIVVPGFELQTPEIRNIILTRVQEVLSADKDPQEALDEAQEEAEQLP